MKHRKRNARKRSEVKIKARRERQEEYQAIIQPDPLLKEVGETNERIVNPDERGRIIPSRPC